MLPRSNTAKAQERGADPVPARLLRPRTQLQTWALRLALALLAPAAAAGMLSGEKLAAQTPAAQPAKAAEQNKTGKPAQQHRPAPVHRRAAAYRHPSASTQHRAAQEAAAAQPPAPVTPPAPKWPVNEPAKEAKVTWDSQGLEIEASNSSLDQILHDVATDTGAKVQGLSEDQRIFGTYGPGPARDVLFKLLDGTGYNVLILGGSADGAPQQILLTTMTPASEQTAQNKPSRNSAEEDSEADEPAPEPSYPPEPPRPEPIQNPFGNGVPARTPQEMMQEMQQRQQQIEQQREQQNNPQ